MISCDRTATSLRRGGLRRARTIDHSPEWIVHPHRGGELPIPFRGARREPRGDLGMLLRDIAGLTDIVGQIARDHSSKDDMLSQFFNRGAFALPAIGRYGTAARNMFSGPGLASVDSAFLKDIAFSEKTRFQLRAEFSNLFNRANFSNPIAQLANPRYGQITGAGAGRAAQLGLKFLW